MNRTLLNNKLCIVQLHKRFAIFDLRTISREKRTSRAQKCILFSDNNQKATDNATVAGSKYNINKAVASINGEKHNKLWVSYYKLYFGNTSFFCFPEKCAC